MLPNPTTGQAHFQQPGMQQHPMGYNPQMGQQPPQMGQQPPQMPMPPGQFNPFQDPVQPSNPNLNMGLMTGQPRYEFVGGDAPPDMTLFAYNIAVNAMARFGADQFNLIAKAISDTMKNRYRGIWCVMVYRLGTPLGANFFNESNTLSQFNINDIRVICFKSHK